MITRYTPPFRSQVPPQWWGACAAVAGGGPNRATAIVVARLVFTISGPSRAFTTLRLIDVVTAVPEETKPACGTAIGRSSRRDNSHCKVTSDQARCVAITRAGTDE